MVAVLVDAATITGGELQIGAIAGDAAMAITLETVMQSY